MSQSTIYLDHAAATPLDPSVLRTMQAYLGAQFYNPSATYSAAREVRRALEKARADVAHWLGAKPGEVIFTAGGTEANNVAIHGVMRQFTKSNVVVSSVEHESVLAPASRYDHHQASVDSKGRIKLDDLQRAIDDNTVLVSVMYANNEVGTIQPIREIAQIINKIRKQRLKQADPQPLYLHTDACQATNYLDLHVAGLGVDLLTINGGKIYGPKQSGALYVKAGVPLLPLIDGGGQEGGLRSGTENIAGTIGLAMALDIVQRSRQAEIKRLQQLQSEFIQQITSRLPQTIINGPLKKRLPNNVHVTIPGTDNERLLIQLDQAGIHAAAGSACSASDETPSHVLRAMGLSDGYAQGSLRFTMGRATNLDMICSTVLTLKRLIS